MPKKQTKPTMPSKARRQMRAALAAEIRRLERGSRMLERVDADVLAAGIESLESEAVLALWLCEPAHALGGKVPLHVMRSAKGRQQVASILRAIAQGVYL